MAIGKNKKTISKGRKALIISISIVIILGVGAIVARNVMRGPAEEKVNYTVRKETFENIIEISGNILAASSQSLKAAGAGTVQAVYVKEGDSVKKGQVLIQLDSTEQEYNLAKLDYDIAQKKISGSTRELELMQTQRAMLVQKLEDRQITAYFDGIVASLSVAEGDYLEAKDTVGTLIDRQYMKADVEVVETDVAKLTPGQLVHFTFPAYTQSIIEGYVVSYPAVGTITSRGATVINAEIRIDNPPKEILPNYSFTGEIEITAPVTLVIVERQAIGYKSGKAFAEVVQKDGTTKEVEVKVEPYGTKYVSILSGLNEGDVVSNQGGTKSGTLRVSSTSGSTSGSAQGGGGMGGAPSGGPSGGMPSGGMPGM